MQVSRAPADLVTAPITWTSTDPHLFGAFAPVGPELEAADLTVIAGRIPADLRGAYMRNGPNPLFQPISYTYPLDGDGMIHAVYFDNGRARYKNRFVRTRGLAVERRAGHAVYGGVMRPVDVDPALVGAEGEPGPFKNGAFISVLHHGDHLLALSEAAPAYEMTMELETIGEWQAGSGRPLELGAHNRRHPVTGDLFALCYSVTEPVVTIHQIDPSGTLKRSFPVALAAPSMIHDFVLTETQIVLLIGPAIFDMGAMMEGKPFLQWRPDFGSRIGVVAQDGSAARWIETDSFFVFHFANGFDRGNRIVVDYVRHGALALGGGDRGAPPRLHRMEIDPAGQRLTDTPLAGFVTEFPRINDRREAVASRFIYAPTRTANGDPTQIAAGTFNALSRLDSETGDRLTHDFGPRLGGEGVFIPRPGATEEDDGYLAVFTFDPAAATSDLVLLDAARIDSEPVAVIRLPQRVPQGLHGTWVPR